MSERKAYPIIVFDFGGVLLDWNPRYLYQKLFNGNSAAMERFLHEIGFHDWNTEQDKGRPFVEGIAELCKRFPKYANLINVYYERWEESVAGPIVETVEILRLLKHKGYSLYGLSNWSAETFHLVRSRYDFLNWFKAIVISGEVKLVKPDPRIFEVLLQRISNPAEKCLFIDDSEINISVAREMGFNTIHYRSPEQLERELSKRNLL